MDWKEVLAKIRLAEMEAKVEGEQVGVINVRTENKTFNFHFHNPEAVRAFMEVEKSPEMQQAIINEAANRLISFMPSSGDFSVETREEMAAASTATASLDVAQKWKKAE